MSIANKKNSSELPVIESILMTGELISSLCLVKVDFGKDWLASNEFSRLDVVIPSCAALSRFPVLSRSKGDGKADEYFSSL